MDAWERALSCTGVVLTSAERILLDAGEVVLTGTMLGVDAALPCAKGRIDPKDTKSLVSSKTEAQTPHEEHTV